MSGRTEELGLDEREEGIRARWPNGCPTLFFLMRGNDGEHRGLVMNTVAMAGGACMGGEVSMEKPWLYKRGADPAAWT